MGRGPQLEAMTKELFNLHDLNGNGSLEEGELVHMNEMIAVLHTGEMTDIDAVKTKYSGIFRDQLDPDGDSVCFEKFRMYTFKELDRLDPDEHAQTMIVAQLIAEATLALETFSYSVKTKPWNLNTQGVPKAAGIGGA